jgi:hypothetical protein
MRDAPNPRAEATWGDTAMIEMLVGGFLLTGSVCVLEDGDIYRDCRDVPAIRFGNRYSCDQRVETILGSFPYVRPERLGFPEGERLRVQVKCKPAAAGA